MILGLTIVSNLEERFSHALHSTARAWRAAVDRRLKDLGVSQAGWMTIAATAKATEPLSQTELANRLGVEGSTMVAMIDRLVSAGLLERQASAADRRVRFVALTAAGEKMYARVKKEAEAFRKELMVGLDPATLLAATELLEHMERVASAAE